MSLVDELNDNCFALATECLVGLSHEIEQEVGRKPTLAELCELLEWGFKTCAADILEDVDPVSVVALKASVARPSRAKVSLVPGDIFAVPAQGGRFYFLVFITSNTFGNAYGVLDGLHYPRPLQDGFDPHPVGHPVYSGRRYVAAGRWRRIGNYRNLLDLFPRGPEIFHAKAGYNLDNPRVGPFGSGENAGGIMRDLSELEARELGLLSGEYQQCMLEEEFEAFLHKRVGRLARPVGAA